MIATELLKRDHIITLTPSVSLSWFVRRRVRKAVRLLNQVVELSPDNWAALWVTGKAHQALGDSQSPEADVQRENSSEHSKQLARIMTKPCPNAAR
ncbi:MAG: hypothetical protein WDO69_07915 [Pseudomonadota bacterium]